MKQTTAFLSILLFACLSVFSQNLGINNTDPRVSIDITGGLAHRAVTLNPVDNMLNLPANISFVIIGNTGVTGPVTLTDPETPINGRRLVLLNNSGFTATLGNFSIADGTIREFVCSGPGGWHLLTPSFSTNPSWLTTGNFGTDTAINFLGTIDDMELAFRTNNLERMRLTNDGLKIRGELRLELGYGIENKPWGNGTIFYNLLGNNPTLDIYGAGNDFTGYDRRITFWAQGGASFTGGASFNGSLIINGEVKPNGNEGQAGQVLTSIGAGQMKWDFPEKTGQMIEVSPFTTDTAALAEQGYQIMGTQTRTLSKTTTNGGSLSPLVNTPQIDPASHLFHFAAQNRIFVVGSNTISSISLADATFGAITNHTVPAFNLNNKVPIFTGTRILIYPHFIFDCATATTTAFPGSPCAGFTVTPAQAWTGSKLVIYGPTGGITYDPATNITTCIETTNGNLYRPGSTAVWSGSRVIFYGGYIKVGADTISADGGLEYNPTTNIWTDIPAGGPRIHGHQALWTGTEMMIFGGRTDEFYTSTGVNFYNPATFTWNSGYTPVGGPFYTTAHTRSHLASNKVFVYNILNLDVLSTTFHSAYFDLSTKSWVAYTPALRNGSPRAPAVSVKVNTDVYFFPDYRPCGFITNHLHFFAQESNPVYMYPKYNANLATSSPKKIASNAAYAVSFGMHGGALNYQVNRNRWTRASTTNQPADREGNICLPIGNNSFFIWGGKSGTTYLNNGAIYNAATNSWTTVASTNAPSARSAATAAFGNGKILVWGGNAGGAYLNNGKLYDVATNTWTNVNTAGAPTCGNHLHIEWNGSQFQTYCNGVNTYDAVANLWQFVYPDARSTVYSSSGNEFQIAILGQSGVVYQKATNVHYDMDGNGLEFVANQTQFLNDNDIFLPGQFGAQVYNAVSKDFKFTNLAYAAETNLLHPLLHPSSLPNKLLILGVRPENESCSSYYPDALMLFQPNTGPGITRDINVQSLIYRKD